MGKCEQAAHTMHCHNGGKMLVGYRVKQALIICAHLDSHQEAAFLHA